MFHQFVREETMGDSNGSIIKVKLTNVWCSFLVCWVSLLIVKCYHVGEAQSPLRISMLTTPRHLLVLVFGNGFQDYFLHSIPRDWGEAVTGLQFPESSFLPFLKEGAMFTFFPSSEFLPHTPIAVIFHDLLTTEWSHNDMSQLPQYVWVHLITAHGSVCVQFV